MKALIFQPPSVTLQLCNAAVNPQSKHSDCCSGTVHPVLFFCFIACSSSSAAAAVNKSPLLLLGSDGRLPVWLRDGVIADLVAAQSDKPHCYQKENSDSYCLQITAHDCIVSVVPDETVGIETFQDTVMLSATGWTLSWLVSLSTLTQTRRLLCWLGLVSARTASCCASLWPTISLMRPCQWCNPKWPKQDDNASELLQEFPERSYKYQHF